MNVGFFLCTSCFSGPVTQDYKFISSQDLIGSFSKIILDGKCAWNPTRPARWSGQEQETQDFPQECWIDMLYTLETEILTKDMFSLEPFQYLCLRVCFG